MRVKKITSEKFDVTKMMDEMFGREESQYNQSFILQLLRSERLILERKKNASYTICAVSMSEGKNMPIVIYDYDLFIDATR